MALEMADIGRVWEHELKTIAISSQKTPHCVAHELRCVCVWLVVRVATWHSLAVIVKKRCPIHAVTSG